MNHRHAFAFLKKSKELYRSESRFQTYVAAGFAASALVILYIQFGRPAKKLYSGLVQG